jgi:hypothetical protein
LDAFSELQDSEDTCAGLYKHLGAEVRHDYADALSKHLQPLVLAARLLIDPLLPDRKLLTWYSGRDTGYAEAAGSFQHEDDMGEALLITKLWLDPSKAGANPVW